MKYCFPPHKSETSFPSADKFPVAPAQAQTLYRNQISCRILPEQARLPDNSAARGIKYSPQEPERKTSTHNPARGNVHLPSAGDWRKLSPHPPLQTKAHLRESEHRQKRCETPGSHGNSLAQRSPEFSEPSFSAYLPPPASCPATISGPALPPR